MIAAIVVLGLTAGALLPAAAQQREIPRPDTLRDEIVRVNQAMMDAYNRGDALAVAAFYTDDARMVGPTGTVAGRDAINTYWTSFPTAGRRWKLDVLETGGDRNTAYQLGRSNISGPNGASVTEFVGIWKRQPNGELKLALDAWTSVRPTSEGAPDSLLALDRGWARSYAEHDTAFARNLFANELVVISGNGSLKNKEGELADVRPQPNLKMDYFRTRDVLVSVHGSTALVTGIAEWSFTMNGRPSTTRRRFTEVYLRGGPLGWRMVVLHIRPAN